MKRIVIASVVMMLLFALAAQAQTPPPGPEHKKLGVWLGNWTGESKDEDSPFGKGGLTKSTSSCTWFSGEYQVVCNGEHSGPAGTTKVLDILGYSVAKKQYFVFFAESTGDSAMIPGKVDGSVWTYETSDTVQGKTYQFRVAFKFASPKEYTFKSEYSEEGKTWKLLGEGKSVKK
jgi:hypothetical protein